MELQESSRSLLTECFRQFGIDSVSMTAEKADRLVTEQFEACVIRVGSHAAPLLESARNVRKGQHAAVADRRSTSRR